MRKSICETPFFRGFSSQRQRLELCVLVQSFAHPSSALIILGGSLPLVTLLLELPSNHGHPALPEKVWFHANVASPSVKPREGLSFNTWPQANREGALSQEKTTLGMYSNLQNVYSLKMFSLLLVLTLSCGLLLEQGQLCSDDIRKGARCHIRECSDFGIRSSLKSSMSHLAMGVWKMAYLQR